ncbi:MAG: HEAT repeat domain-containing protein [Elusimicrobia bacterium]|nr:HEAT repeat domain-containing protein [Elusimicrobiota bacterium]
MKYLISFVIFIVAGFFAFRQMRPKPLPPPPPPPPILQEPLPVINEEEQQKIIKSANDSDPAVRWEALLLLDKMRSPQAYPLLFEKLRKDQEAQVRIKVAKLLAARNTQDVAQNLVWALRDREAEVRIAVLQSLDQLGNYATASAITEASRDPDESVRVQALKTLNSLQDKRAAEIELARQKHEEEIRRRQAEAAKKR